MSDELCRRYDIFVTLQENTFQVILITDGTYSYTIFTYLCGLLEWDNGVTIGFNAASEIYENFIPSSSAVACLNIPYSVWSNVVYRLSAASNELPPPCTFILICNPYWTTHLPH